MIVEQLQLVTSDTADKMSNVLFYNRDAKLVAKEFIKFPGIVQVGVFGATVRYNFGYNIHLALVVSDEAMFNRYLDVVWEYHERTVQIRDERQVRLAAFDVLWGRHRPAWHKSHKERDINLRDHLDLTVLPFDWQSRVDALEPVLGSASPVSLSDVIATVTFLETQV